MPDNNKNINGSGEFDGLMDQMFLELDFNDPKNDKILDAISQDVLGDNRIIPNKPNRILKKIAGKFNLNSILLFSVLSSIAIAIGFMAYFGDAKPTVDKIVSEKYSIENSDANTIKTETENKKVDEHSGTTTSLEQNDEAHVDDKKNVQDNSIEIENILENSKPTTPVNKNYVTQVNSDITETKTGPTIRELVKLPNADAMNAIEIKDSIAGPFNVSLGNGLQKEYKSDFGRETNSAWFKFKIHHDTTLTFDIAPLYSRDNYDFVLFKCSDTNDIAKNETGNLEAVRECWSQWSYKSGMTGLSQYATDTKVGKGPGPAYVSPVQVKAGETYYLMINYGEDYIYPKIFPWGFIICFYNYSPQKYPTDLDHIYFETGTAVLKTKSSFGLDELVKMLKNSQAAIEIRAYTGNEENERKNRLLSEQRAKVVVDYLVSKNINKHRLFYKGLGSYKSSDPVYRKKGPQKISKLEYVRLMH